MNYEAAACKVLSRRLAENNPLSQSGGVDWMMRPFEDENIYLPLAQRAAKLMSAELAAGDLEAADRVLGRLWRMAVFALMTQCPVIDRHIREQIAQDEDDEREAMQELDQDLSR